MEAALSTEITVLGWSVVLLIVHIVWQASSATMDTGLGYNMSARDTDRQVSVISSRLNRALRNFLETYAAFVGLALALHVTGNAGGIGAVGAVLWLLARVAYVPIFAFGIARIRTAVWAASIVGLLLMLIRLMF